jgi:hypothetical protein
MGIKPGNAVRQMVYVIINTMLAQLVSVVMTMYTHLTYNMEDATMCLNFIKMQCPRTVM